MILITESPVWFTDNKPPGTGACEINAGQPCLSTNKVYCYFSKAPHSRFIKLHSLKRLLVLAWCILFRLGPKRIQRKLLETEKAKVKAHVLAIMSICALNAFMPLINHDYSSLAFDIAVVFVVHTYLFYVCLNECMC